MSKELEPRYEKLSQFQKGEVLNDMKQHLNLSQAQHESPNICIVPVTRAEWERERESSVEMGISERRSGQAEHCTLDRGVQSRPSASRTPGQNPA